MPSTANPNGATATAGTAIGVPVSVPTPTTIATMSSGGIGATTITNMVRPAGIDGARASWLGLQAATRVGPGHSRAAVAPPRTPISQALPDWNPATPVRVSRTLVELRFLADAPSEIERRPRNRHRRSSPRTTRGQNGGEARRIEACTGCKAAAMSEAPIPLQMGTFTLDRLTGAGSFPALVTLALAHVGQFFDTRC
jgi:hypothetical protein